jgi:hypothetical protein
VVDDEADLLGIKVPGAVHVGHGDDHHFEFPVHERRILSSQR